MTGDTVPFPLLFQHRAHFGADIGSVTAAGVETASPGGMHRRGHIPFENLRLHIHLGVRRGNRREKALSVGMPGVPVQLTRCGLFHDSAQVHHHDAVRHVLHHRKIVGHEEQREAEILLEIDEQVENLGLNREIQSGHRLVAHDEGGVGGQGPGDADSLALSPGELVGIAVGRRRGQAHPVQQIPHQGVQSAPGVGAELPGALADNILHHHVGVQAGPGILKNHLNLPAAPLQAPAVHHQDVAVSRQIVGLPLQPPDFALQGRSGFPPVDRRNLIHFPQLVLQRLTFLIQRRRLIRRGPFGVKKNPPLLRIVEPQNTAPHRGFPAARFPHQPQGFPPAHLEAHAVHGLQGENPVGKGARLHRKGFFELLHL